MKKNVGKTDKTIRLLVAAVIVVLLVTNTVAVSTTLGIVLAVMAGIFVLTSSVGTCPIYSLLGASTCPVKK